MRQNILLVLVLENRAKSRTRTRTTTRTNGKVEFANRLLAWIFHTRGSSAGLRACCIAGFQTCGRSARFDALPIWKSAIQQVWKPALRRLRPTVESECEIFGLEGVGWVGSFRQLGQQPLRQFCRRVLQGGLGRC